MKYVLVRKYLPIYLAGIFTGLIISIFAPTFYLADEGEDSELLQIEITESDIRKWLAEIEIELQQLRIQLAKFDSNLTNTQRAYAIKRNVKGLPETDPDCQRHFNEARQLKTAVDKITLSIEERFQWHQKLQFMLQEFRLEGLINSTPENSQLISEIRSRVNAQEFMQSPSFLDYSTTEEEDPDEFMGISKTE